MTNEERELDFALAEAEAENKLLRARNERLEREATAAGHTIEQLVTALEGSGTTMRSEQWYVEIEAVAAGKHHLNSIEARVREACALQVEKAGIDGYGTLAAAALIRKGEHMIDDDDDDTQGYLQPKREWVGLTEEERFLNDFRSSAELEYAKAIEAKLREKNRG